MTLSVILLSVSTALAAAGFVAVSVMWFRKLRGAVHTAIGEMAAQQVRSAHKFGEAIGQLQKQQCALDQQVQDLVRSAARLRQDMAVIASRVELSDREQRQQPSDRILH